MARGDEFKIRSRDRSIPIEIYSRLPRLPLSVVLENLRSGFNVGAIFRTCEAARVERLITCGITAHPPNEKVLKTSMGTWEFIPHEHVNTAGEVIARLRRRGVQLVALETTSHSESIYRAFIPRPCCLFLGSEALGLSLEVLDAVDRIVEIPLQGYKNSLNVSVALGIALFEILRQWGETPNSALENELP